MKKIGLLTTHASMNYGGLLQAYALKRQFEGLNVKCDIINYIPPMQNASKNPIQFLFKRENAIGKAILVLKNREDYKKRMKLITDFRHNYLYPVPENGIDYDMLPKVVEQYDLICCGSDQLWNLNLGDMENGAYTLNFRHSVPVVSYAISFGDGLKTQREKIINSLKDIRKFKRISVREEEGQRFLSENGIDSVISVDPTLLLKPEEWSKMTEKVSIKKPYILLYGFNSAYQTYEDLVAAAKNISKVLGLPVVNTQMVPKLAKAGFENHFQCGPIEFLSIIKNASYVCTNSFHATVFSNIFKIPYSVVYNEKLGLDDRKETLLKLFGMSDRKITGMQKINSNALLDCSFDRTIHMMEQKIMDSKDYIRSIVED